MPYMSVRSLHTMAQLLGAYCPANESSPASPPSPCLPTTPPPSLFPSLPPPLPPGGEGHEDDVPQVPLGARGSQRVQHALLRGEEGGGGEGEQVGRKGEETS